MARDYKIKELPLGTHFPGRHNTRENIAAAKAAKSKALGKKAKPFAGLVKNHERKMAELRRNPVEYYRKIKDRQK